MTAMKILFVIGLIVGFAIIVYSIDCILVDHKYRKMWQRRHKKYLELRMNLKIHGIKEGSEQWFDLMRQFDEIYPLEYFEFYE